ncbi:MAG: cobalt-precorrin-5B (C(1))-methyltransferase, partial [Deltaproteobacteria bacterium]|nr:cobalt-precorrin-5B (C(1))-methyltransferase [Deltaproteobacteria bacterium]
MHLKKKLRTGYTTGTCAAAAAKGALLWLLGRRPEHVTLQLPAGLEAVLPVCAISQDDASAACEVIKDGGDDPDVTNGAAIQAQVSLRSDERIAIHGGAGVGLVTRPGLAVAPGEPAINPVPRMMIKTALQEILPSGTGADVTISVSRGKELAKKTLNPRLGITGGISILGSTGIVIPYSH